MSLEAPRAYRSLRRSRASRNVRPAKWSPSSCITTTSHIHITDIVHPIRDSTITAEEAADTRIAKRSDEKRCAAANTLTFFDRRRNAAPASPEYKPERDQSPETSSSQIQCVESDWRCSCSLLIIPTSSVQTESLDPEDLSPEVKVKDLRRTLH